MKNYIIIVEDDATLAEGLQIILRDENYIVDIARDSVICDKFLRLQLPTLIVIDYRLPGENGERLITRLRSQETTKHIPLILTSASHSDMRKIAKTAGADAFLAKPFSIAVFLALTEKLIRRKKANALDLQKIG
jgi:two-component system phosphate regulon response regulator PhoB